MKHYAETLLFMGLVALFVLLFEVLVVLEDRPTISEVFQWWSRSFAWLKWGVIPGWAWLYYHLFWE